MLCLPFWCALALSNLSCLSQETVDFETHETAGYETRASDRSLPQIVQLINQQKGASLAFSLLMERVLARSPERVFHQSHLTILLVHLLALMRRAVTRWGAGADAGFRHGAHACKTCEEGKPRAPPRSIAWRRDSRQQAMRLCPFLSRKAPKDATGEELQGQP